MERSISRSKEEADQLTRSAKKIKKTTLTGTEQLDEGDSMLEDADTELQASLNLDSPRAPDYKRYHRGPQPPGEEILQRHGSTK